MSARVCIFGEVLFDHFPDGQRVLGGAPFNVAWHLQAFGQAPRLLSRVGADPEGEAVRQAMRDWGMDDSGVGTDPALPTGRVEVSFEAGEPAYDIVAHCAYDAIEASDPIAYDLLYHGSLALRQPASRRALETLRASRASPKAAQGLVFLDVNLRPPWWRADEVRAMLDAADWVKLNSDELALLQPPASRQASPPLAAQALLEEHHLSGVILTLGAAGALLLHRDGTRCSIAPQPGIALVDTVGAGDAFTSIVILGLLEGWPLQQMLERAQQFASRVVGLRGATTTDSRFYEAFTSAWRNPH